MSYTLKEDVPYRLIILNPSQIPGGSRRRKFVIEKRLYDQVTWKYIRGSDEGIDEETSTALFSINARYKSQKLNFEDARKEVEQLVHSLYKKDRALSAPVFNTANQRVLDEYLDACYPVARRKKIDFPQARNEAQRAINALGSLSIQSATAKEMQSAVDKSYDGNPNGQRRVIFKLRAMLAWLRPSESWKYALVPDDADQKPVKHLSEDDFKLVLPHLPTPAHKEFAKLCFYLGCRVGEGMALTPSDYREKRDCVLIAKQISIAGHAEREVKARTKNKRIREAFLFPAGKGAFRAWTGGLKLELSKEEREKLSREMKKACAKAFGSDETRHLTWHDLRHCYAIRLLDKGLTIDDVADMIGDSVVVAKKHYVGFVVSDARMERIRRLATK
jgi:integrase